MALPSLKLIQKLIFVDYNYLPVSIRIIFFGPDREVPNLLFLNIQLCIRLAKILTVLILIGNSLKLLGQLKFSPLQPRKFQLHGDIFHRDEGCCQDGSTCRGFWITSTYPNLNTWIIIILDGWEFIVYQIMQSQWYFYLINPKVSDFFLHFYPKFVLGFM